MSRLLPALEGLGTAWRIEVFDEMDDKTAEVAVGDLSSFITTFEAKYSRFKKDSLITTLNETRVLNNPDPETLSLLKLGQTLFTNTDGVFNFLVGQVLEARGYDANYSFTSIDWSSELPNPLNDLVIEDDVIRLQTGKVDLGGFGKGWLLDRVVERLIEAHGITHALVNGGGDIYATSDCGQPIEIYLEHPRSTGTYVAKTRLKDCGFAASSTHKRRWKSGGKEYSHIVDTTPPKSVSVDDYGIYVKAPSAVTADAWSTTLLIRDPSSYVEFLLKDRIEFARLNIQDNTLQTSARFNLL